MKKVGITNTIVISTFLIFAATLSRLLPHIPNFTPIAAVGLLAAAYFSDRKMAFVVTFMAMILSDVFLGFHSSMIWVYGALLIIILGGRLLRNNVSVLNVLIASLFSSFVFFIITNFGVWLSSGMYTLDSKGLVSCFIMAIPFFGNTLLGDFVYNSVLFGCYYMAKISFPKLQLA